MMKMYRKVVQANMLRLGRRLGSAVAAYWPWPVGVRVEGRPFYVDLRSAVGRGIFMNGTFDPKVFEPIRAVLTPGDTFLDVGANIGWYSFLAGQRVGGTGKVHAFEIGIRPLHCLKRTVRANPDLPIALHQVAVGDCVGEARFKDALDSGHSHLAVDSGRVVLMRTLDDWMADASPSRIRVMKIDVEGAEFRVLSGAKALLQAHRPRIICELEEDTLRRFGASAEHVAKLLHEYEYGYRYVRGAWSTTICADPIEAGRAGILSARSDGGQS